jgi:hypothetical protein
VCGLRLRCRAERFPGGLKGRGPVAAERSEAGSLSRPYPRRERQRATRISCSATASGPRAFDVFLGAVVGAASGTASGPRAFDVFLGAVVGAASGTASGPRAFDVFLGAVVGAASGTASRSNPRT